MVMMICVSPAVLKKFLNWTTETISVGWLLSSVLKAPSPVIPPSKPELID